MSVAAASPTDPAHVAVRGGAATLIWRRHPARERPGQAAAATTVVLLLALGAAFFLDASGLGFWFTACAAALVLLGSLHRYYLPTEYAVDADGVRMRSLFGVRTRAWSTVRSVRRQDEVLTLSSRPTERRWEWGATPVLLPLDASTATAVRSWIETRTAGEAPGSPEAPKT